MEDPTVTDILIDNFDKIYVERGKLEPTELRFDSATQLRRLITPSWWPWAAGSMHAAPWPMRGLPTVPA
jgi:hypothetical protein